MDLEIVPSLPVALCGNCNWRVQYGKKQRGTGDHLITLVAVQGDVKILDGSTEHIRIALPVSKILSLS